MLMGPYTWQRVSELERRCINLRRMFILLLASPGICTLLLGINLPVWFHSVCLALAVRIIREFRSCSLQITKMSQGLEAEDQVYNLLQTLPSDWKTERHIRVHFYEMDFVVTTPQGITIVIEVKSHKGRIFLQEGKLERDNINKLEGDFLETLRSCASMLSIQRDLPLVLGVLVFTQAKVKVPSAKIDEVFVREKNELIPLLHSIDAQTRKFNSAHKYKNAIEPHLDIVAEPKEEYTLSDLVEKLDFKPDLDIFEYKVKQYECYKCQTPIVVYTWNNHQMWSQEMPPQPIPRSIKYRLSNSAGKKYWVNTCQSCAAIQGDSYIHSNKDWVSLAELVNTNF